MKKMLKQIFSIITLAAAAIAAAIPSAFLWLLAGRKQKKKNSGNERIKKCNSADCFTAINAVEKEDDEEEAKAKTSAEVAAAIVAVALEAGDIYKNDA